MSTAACSNQLKITILQHERNFRFSEEFLLKLKSKGTVEFQQHQQQAEHNVSLSPTSNDSRSRSNSCTSAIESANSVQLTPVEESYMSSEGQEIENLSSCSTDDEHDKLIAPIRKMSSLINEIDSVYRYSQDWDIRKEELQEILERADLSTEEVNKFTHWDNSKSYTRNLAHSTDDYTLLILCWSPGKESKIHNHPGESCFIKTLRGCIREVVYKLDEASDNLLPLRTRFYNEGQVSWMSDKIGLHKISNPCREGGSVTLHLYTPPFAECKVWNNCQDKASAYEIAKMGFFSVMGLRTPQLEGKPGTFAQLMQELKSATSSLNTSTASFDGETDSDNGETGVNYDHYEGVKEPPPQEQLQKNPMRRVDCF